jgi:hypothetical protein
MNRTPAFAGYEFKEYVARIRRDVDRHEATADDDHRWFKTNPARRFRLRPTTPHERYGGVSDKWVLVMRIPGVSRLRSGVQLESKPPSTDAECTRLFERILDCHDPRFRNLICELRRLEALAQNTPR